MNTWLPWPPVDCIWNVTRVHDTALVFLVGAVHRRRRVLIGLEHRTVDGRPGFDIRSHQKYPPSTHGFHAKIVEVDIGGVAIYRPFREFHRANTCHLYGAQGLGQRQPYF
ncbi:hypothetical protein TNCV_3371011 [Trichonephila clavipes]|nr:hypothetical protein TNCV_3371011 [Trichonephila clavipes]